MATTANGYIAKENDETTNDAEDHANPEQHFDDHRCDHTFKTKKAFHIHVNLPGELNGIR